MIIRLACIAAGYLFGLFQTAYFYGKMKGIDIRTVGSGNAGSTNALRAFGTKAGITVFAGDCLKCVIVVLLVRRILGRFYPDLGFLLSVYAAVGCILGHNFPFYLGFRGGKGIASTAGLILTFPWQMVIVGLVSFFGPVILTHYVSLGSLLAITTFIIGAVLMGQTGRLPAAGTARIELYILVLLIAALAFYQHRENIKRLLNGTERKTYLFKKN